MAKKILYAIQGTGNGHLSRAMDIVPLLKLKGEVDVLVSGKQGDLKLPFDVKYRCHGMGFVFGKSGGVDFWKSFQKADTRKFIKEINQLPVNNYDLIVSDFEPVSAWACHFADKPCIGLSHQVAVLNNQVPKPDTTDLLGKMILKQYAPVTAQYGFHFKAFGHNIFTPVVRQEVREQPIGEKGHYTVYLPAYDDERLIRKLVKFKHIEWQVFSKHNKKPVDYKNIAIEPISNQAFIKSMASAQGVLCGAGFETPAEALFMKKKLLVIPMKNQYEQQLNAAALKAMGMPVIRSLKTKHESTIQQWLDSGKIIEVHYPNQTEEILELIIKEHAH
ncbi:glycosyltransferase family protein [Mucilaginibacter galii]|uniref:Glycosyl transferase n=1 Tax=Mucilaginibacter galii TaxID=2005073 RepID=A0A917JBS8_9SPHI|nr:glycosyltransferase family protein [Mucilaginibacter galii]GGI51717.1 glycosyl transferase [Mucilaginibacter galii]